MTSLPDRGRLGVLPLPALLLLIEQAAFSGRLVLAHGDVSCDAACVRGRVVRVRANGAGLAAALVARGKLSPADAARLAVHVADQAGTEEKALLALRLFTPRGLVEVLREHAREALVSCFSWPEGEFALHAADSVPLEATALAQDPVALVHAGITAHWPNDRIAAALGAAGVHGALPGPGFEAMRSRVAALPGFDGLTARLDGTVPLGDVAIPRAECVCALVLHLLGLLEPAETAVTPDDAPILDASQADNLDIEIVSVRRPGPDAATAGVPRAEARRASTLSPAATAARRALLEIHETLGDLDHYALLGVPRDADATQVKRAYLAAAKTYHPDGLARLGLDDVREAANTVFGRISRAHDVLSDPEARRDYDEGLLGGGADEAQRIASAETFYRKGDILLRKGSFGEALQYLRPAVELCDDDASYRTALGWALFKQTPSDAESARAELERAVVLAPQSALAHQRLGSVLRALGKVSEAADHLAKARVLDPRVAR